MACRRRRVNAAAHGAAACLAIVAASEVTAIAITAAWRSALSFPSGCSSARSGLMTAL